MPKYLSSDHDSLYKFHQWQANLRILEVTEVKTVPYVPLSHPFVERLIGTIRCEYLDHTLFWTSADLENKLLDFKTYYNHHRTHHAREGRTPDTPASHTVANLRSFRWQPHCRALLVAMVKSSDLRNRHDAPAFWLLHGSRFRSIFGQRQMSSGTLVIGKIALQSAA